MPSAHVGEVLPEGEILVEVDARAVLGKLLKARLGSQVRSL
jgi:hypothetical protein